MDLHSENVRRAAKEDPAGLYPPEYIETSIREDGAGAVAGHYRARYRLANQALSPYVDFDFQGGAIESATNAILQWISDDGARGEIKLTRIGADSLKVSWNTVRMGRVRSLISGTAVLTRVN